MLTIVVPLEKISYLDYPELLINEHERTEMPFRYVKGEDGKPIMPDVSKTEKRREYSYTSRPLADHWLTTG